MKIILSRNDLLSPLQQVIGAVERKHTMASLSYVLLQIENGLLSLTGTDLEIELVASAPIDTSFSGATTLPGRKLMDICKNLPESAQITLTISPGKVTLTAERSRFVLATVPVSEFPSLDGIGILSNVKVAQTQLRKAIEKTAFAMAQQDVRYYLNGLMLELANDKLRSVATDGHRLSLSEAAINVSLDETRQVIIPRKGVMELQRLLQDTDDFVEIGLSNNHIRVLLGGLSFTSKLIDGRFPDYARVIPADCDKTILIDKLQLRQALTRVSILSNEKYKGVRLSVSPAVMRIQTQNPEQEEAEEELSIDYTGDLVEIGFNVTYLLDVLNVLETDKIQLSLKDSNSSCLISDPADTASRYVIMPMRL